MAERQRRRRLPRWRSPQSVQSCCNDEHTGCTYYTCYPTTTFLRGEQHRFNQWLVAMVLLAFATRIVPAHSSSNHHREVSESNIFDRTARKFSSSSINTNYNNNSARTLDDGFFDDAMYDEQRWVFDMIDLIPVWSQGIFGNGVRVRVNDGGIDETNTEFEGRFDQGASCPQKERNENNNIFNPNFDANQHGTSVASIIGAAANNGECAVGVAPETTLSWCDALNADESFLDYRIEAMDVSQNSYEINACKSYKNNAQRRTRTRNRTLQTQKQNPRRRVLQQRKVRPIFEGSDRCPFAVPGAAPCTVCDNFASNYFFDDNDTQPRMPDECVQSIVRHCDRYFQREEEEGTGACSEFLDLIIGGECSYQGLSTTAQRSISNGIRLGRNGLGIVYVFASGNSYYEGDNTNLKGYTTSRHTISIGAVGKDGTHSHYSTGGASLFLSAPGGDSEDQQKHIVARVSGGCTSTDYGTSFASPVVSGVVALVLETNPSLGWRDVQGILAQSAKPVQHDPFDRTSVVNGAGLWHSNLYGFGIVNAHRAVEMAKTWTKYGVEQVFAVDSGLLNYPIFDKSDPAIPTTSSVIIAPNLPEENSFVVESVELLLDVVHISRGDLKITITSPYGIESVLHPGKLPENAQLDTLDNRNNNEEGQFWKLMTVRNREESPFGEWTLKITDEKAGQFQECVDMAGFVLDYDGVKIDCIYLERFEICGKTNSVYAGPVVFRVGGGNDGNSIHRQYSFLESVTNDQGRSVSDACCICGGGTDRESLGRDLLRHWTIAIYGRLDPSRFPPSTNPTEASTTTFPTKVPTGRPSVLPTEIPTMPPTGVPTNTPTILPSFSPTTGAPSTAPSTSPSAVPSSSPTFTESNRPSATPSSFPSGMPSAHPSLLPSATASDSPSESPTPETTQSSGTSVARVGAAGVTIMCSLLTAAAILIPSPAC